MLVLCAAPQLVQIMQCRPLRQAAHLLHAAFCSTASVDSFVWMPKHPGCVCKSWTVTPAICMQRASTQQLGHTTTWHARAPVSLSTIQPNRLALNCINTCFEGQSRKSLWSLHGLHYINAMCSKGSAGIDSLALIQCSHCHEQWLAACCHIRWPIVTSSPAVTGSLASPHCKALLVLIHLQ